MNTTALAIIQPDELDVIQRTAKLLAASGYFGTSDDAIVGMAQVAAKILAGRELGFGPFAAVNGIHLISGKPAIGANLMAAAVRSHPRYDYKVKTLTDKLCELEFYDGGQLAGVSSFSIQEAKEAELTTGKNSHTWKKYPRNMLFARAMSNGVRWYAPDIFSGNTVYVPEELDVRVDGDGNVIDTPYTVTKPANTDVDFGMGSAHNAPQATQQAATAPKSNNGHSNAPAATPSPSTQATSDAGNPFEDTPRYADLIDKLTGDCLERANRARQIHAQSRGPATTEQYRFLAGTIDDIVDVPKAHNAILEIFVGRAVSADNPPGIALAAKMLDALLKERTVERDGEKVKEPNPAYDEAAVNCIRVVWRLVCEANGQQSLFEQAEPLAY